MEKLLFTSESVTEGHPDKVCDAVSDAILDACMAQDPMSRVACETAACTGFVLVTGEITTKAQLDIPSIVRQTVNEIGYNDAKTGFDGIHVQLWLLWISSPLISLWVLIKHWKQKRVH